MTETKRRIKELKALLPNVREKVISVALLLAISLAMVASASYAWYTLSFAPEATEITTTVSSNGSLEVALAGLYDEDGNLIQPLASGTADSFSADGQTTVLANLTWGNLINLSNYYGIESLTLRPAHFDANSMFYLSSAKYGSDGRVEDDKMANFAFTTWMDLGAAGQSAFDFAVSSLFGVRAISSVAFDNSAGESVFQGKMTEASSLGNKAVDTYEEIWENSAYVDVIRDVVQIYLNHEMYYSAKDRQENGNDNILVSVAISTIVNSLKDNHDDDLTANQVQQLATMYKDLYQAIKEQGEAWTYLANVHQYLNSMNDGSGKYDDYTLETFLAASASELKAKGVKIDSSVISAYKSLYERVSEDLQTLEEYAKLAEKGTTIYLTDFDSESEDDKFILPIIKNLIDIDTVIISKGDMSASVSTLMKSMGTAYNFVSALSNGDTIEVKVTKGDLKSFEEQTGTRADVTLSGLSLVIVKNISGHMYTNATNNYFSAAVTATISMDTNYTANLVAQDTYGMVLDLWFRTNAQNSVLTMDGLVTTKTETVPRMIVLSGEAESKAVYAYERPTMMLDKDTALATEVVQVYQVVGEDDVVYYYSVDSRAMVYQYEVVEKYYTHEGEETTKEAYEADVALGDAAQGYSMEYAIIDKVTITYYAPDGTAATKEEYEADAALGEDALGYYYTAQKYPITDEHVTQVFDEIITPTGFAGSNRVYDDLYVESGATSATQGSGSCFVFYADSPEEYTAAEEMLKYLKLAFVDENRTLLATGIFDTDYILPDAGKYVVPVVIETGVEYKDEAGNTCYGIYALDQNEPVKISVIVYLEGEGLENSMAMSDGAIQGKLNLQFGSSVKLSAWKDTNLTMQTVTLSASISGDSFSYEGEAITPKLTAFIDGLNTSETSVVQAIFRRQITSSQGTRIEPVTLTNTSGTVWEGTCNFTLPGTYVLTSIWVDGVEYELPEAITVEISGFSIEAVSFCNSYEGEELALTADSSVSRNVSVKFNTALTPTTVVARLQSDDGKYVSANLTYNPGNGYWEGSAKFTTSGRYTIQYLVIDGVADGEAYSAYYPLPEDMQSDFTAYLGLRARVMLDNYNSDIAFDYLGERNIAIKMQITTDTGAIMGALENVQLSYGKRGSSVLANGLAAALKWDGSYYVGAFAVDKVGVFSFSQVAVGTSNIIKVATSAPSITSRSKEPPVIVMTSSGKDPSRLTTGSNLIVFDDDTNTAYYVTDLKNVESATSVTVVMVTPNGEVTLTIDDTTAREQGYFVTDEETGVTTAYFRIPTDLKTMNGQWTVTEIRVDGVYDAAGKYYGSDSDDAEADYYSLSTSFSFNVLKDVSAELGTLTLDNGAEFMSAQSLATSSTTIDGKVTYNGLYAKLSIDSDALNKLGLSVSEMTLVLDYDKGTSNSTDSSGKSYGGYTYTGETGYETRTLMLKEDAYGGWIVESGDAYLAGTYDGKLTVKLSDGSTYTFSKNKILTVYSESPEVTVTGISPTAGSSYRMFVGSLAADGTTPEATTKLSGFGSTTYSATVYIYAADAGGVDSEAYTPLLPKVTLSIAGMPTNKTYTATMVFANAASSTYNRTYTFTNSATSNEQSIGGGINGQNGFYNWGTDTDPKIFPAGKQSVKEITVTYSGAEFKVTLSHEVTINQPQYPPTLSFAVNDADYVANGGQTPASITSSDGETVTLPSIITLAYDREEITGTATFSATSTTYKASENIYYNYNNYRYRGYYKLGTLYSGSAATTTYHVTKTISQWEINGVTYNAGDTVTLTGNATATAVVSTNEVQGASGNKTLYKWVYSYVATGDNYATEGRYGANGNGYTVKINSITATAESPVSTSADRPANVPDF